MQYSNLGLINDLYNCNINSLVLHINVRLIIPNTALAAPAAFAHCLLDCRVLSIITPKSLSSSTVHKVLVPNT